MANLEAIAQAVETCDPESRDRTVRLVKEALAAGATPEQVLNDGLIAGMTSIGKKFKANEVFIPEVLVAARNMAAAMEVLEPQLVATGVKPRGKVVIGTVKQDLHDIGKNLVAMMLKGGGFQVVDLGVDVDPAKFVAAAQQHGADLIALSALLTTTMPNMRAVVEARKAAGARAKVIIGGAPVTQAFADEIGADGYAADAGSAVDLATALISA
jgi:5-methyltetrahydrofolate--homocysteine methyltransferase